MILIASTTFGSNTTSVTYSSLGSYNHLMIRGSIRCTVPGTYNRAFGITSMTPSGFTNYSGSLSGENGSFANTGSTTFIPIVQGVNAAGNAADVFTDFEYLLPNYSSSANNKISLTNNNSAQGATGNGFGVATTWISQTTPAAITSITLGFVSLDYQITAGSNIRLYGISNT